MSESLRIISFFDALIGAGAGTEAMLRGAAELCGTPVGMLDEEHNDASIADATGDLRRRQAIPEHSKSIRVPGDSRRSVFVSGDAATSYEYTELVLERLALAVSFATHAREIMERPPLEVLIDQDSSAAERQSAGLKMRLDLANTYRVCATPFAASVATTSAACANPSVVVFTGAGMLRAQLGPVPTGRAGIGIAKPAVELDESWLSAFAALRMSSDARPVVDAEELGGLVRPADDRASSDPDVESLRAVVATKDWALRTVESWCCDGSTVRETARVLGVHHSTMQVRLQTLEHDLGFDLAAGLGRARLTAAYFGYLLATQRF
jgi:hypothetical protein